MQSHADIPDYQLFGETDAFPDVLHCEHFEDRAPIHGWRISPHRHAQLAQLFYVKSGTGIATVDGANFELSDNMVLYVPWQTVHEFKLSPHIQGMVQSFPLSVLQSIGPTSDGMIDALSRPFIVSPDLDLVVLLTQLDSALLDDGPFRKQISVGLGHAVLASVARLAVPDREAEETVPNRRLALLDRLIAENMGTERSAKDYAADMGLSTGHLNRLCRAAKGLSVTTYIESAVMQEACRLLAFTPISVSEVGYRVGFLDPSYFSRRFRAVQGATPTQYRAQFNDA